MDATDFNCDPYTNIKIDVMNEELIDRARKYYDTIESE